MNVVAVTTNLVGVKRRGRSGGSLSLVLLTMSALVLGACSLIGGDQDPRLGSANLLVGEAQLLCSQECADRGQCGSAEQGQMVLLSSFGPATRGHDMAIAHNTTVTIEHQELQTVFLQSNNEQFQVQYYSVLVPERGPGWVAGWCIGQ